MATPPIHRPICDQIEKPHVGFDIETKKYYAGVRCFCIPIRRVGKLRNTYAQAEKDSKKIFNYDGINENEKGSELDCFQRIGIRRP